MNILIMNHYATSMLRDQAGRHYWFAKRLQYTHKNQVAIVCASAYLSGSEQLLEKGEQYRIVDDDGVEYILVRTIPATGSGMKRVVNMLLFYLNVMKNWKRIIRSIGIPDVVYASSVHPLTLVAGLKIARKLKKPCICEVRDLWPEGIFTASRIKPTSFIGRLLTSGEHWIYSNSTALIFTKEGDTDYLYEKQWTVEQGGDINIRKCHYINNGVDIKQFISSTETMRIEGIDDRKFNVIYTGTIRPTNNIGLILDAAKLITEYDDIVFLVYGEGNQLQMLTDRIRHERISNVQMMGRVDRKYIPSILTKASVNLLNYSQDRNAWKRGNSSNKLFEYMASGKPIISTVKMGYSIINKYNCGIELDECTPDALAKAILMFHDMPQEERDSYGRNAAEGAKDFDFDILTNKLISVIESVM